MRFLVEYPVCFIGRTKIKFFVEVFPEILAEKNPRGEIFLTEFFRFNFVI